MREIFDLRFIHNGFKERYPARAHTHGGTHQLKTVIQFVLQLDEHTRVVSLQWY